MIILRNALPLIGRVLFALIFITPEFWLSLMAYRDAMRACKPQDASQHDTRERNTLERSVLQYHRRGEACLAHSARLSCRPSIRMRRLRWDARGEFAEAYGRVDVVSQDALGRGDIPG